MKIDRVNIDIRSSIIKDISHYPSLVLSNRGMSVDYPVGEKQTNKQIKEE